MPKPSAWSANGWRGISGDWCGLKAQKNAGKKAKRAAKEKELAAKISVLPNKTHGVILADPPWKFEFFSDAGANYAGYEAARRGLIEARDIDEGKDYRDKALAMEAYAYQAKDAELVAMATEIKRRATRRIGELMAELKAADKLAKNAGRNQHRVFEKPTANPTLAEQGIDKNLADKARKLAAMPEKKFEAETAKVKQMAAEMALGDKEVIAAIRPP